MKILFIVKNTKQNILICLLLQAIVYRYDEWTTSRPAEFENKVENLQVSLIFVL